MENKKDETHENSLSAFGWSFLYVSYKKQQQVFNKPLNSRRKKEPTKGMLEFRKSVHHF